MIFCTFGGWLIQRLNSTMYRSVAQRWSFLVILFILVFLCPEVSGQTALCVKPADLPAVTESTPVGTELLTVSADVTVTWRFEFKPEEKALEQFFQFNRNLTESTFTLTVAKPLDVEEIARLLTTPFDGVALFKVFCKEPNRPETSSDAIFKLKPENEFSPEFNTSSIEISVTENTAPGTSLLRLIDWARDNDTSYGLREIRDFSLAALGTDTQALQLFSLTDTHMGVLSVRGPLDFDSLPTNSVRLLVQVRDNEGLTGTATLTVTVRDEDDLPPVFFYSGCSSPCTAVYRALVNPNTTGAVNNIEPSPIQARDGDSLNYDITYHLVQGPDHYEDHFSLDASTGQLTVVKQLQDLNLQELDLAIEAREVSTIGRSSRASLVISLGAVVGGSQAVASASTDDSILVAAIVLGILFFIVVVCLVVAAICFRKKYKTPVHPESRQPIRKDESPMAEDSPRSRSQHSLSIGSSGFQRQLLGTDIKENGTIKSIDYKEKKSLRGEDEVVTWMPLNTSNDIVDLSDEDTIRKKKNKMHQPPTDTQLPTKDSANENNNTREGTSPQDHYPETEYAEMVTPPQTRKERDSSTRNPIAEDSPSGLPVLLMNRMYGTNAPEPPARDKRGQVSNAHHLVHEDTEYATQRDAELATKPNSHTDPTTKSNRGESDKEADDANRSAQDQQGRDGGFTGYTNKAFIKDEPQRKPPRRPGSKKPPKSKGGERLNSKESIEENSSSAQTANNSGSQTSSTAGDPESQSILNSDGSLSGSGPVYTTENESPRAQTRRQWLSTTTATAVNRGYINTDQDEETEYSVPTSNRSSYAFRPLPVPEDDDETKERSVTLSQTQRQNPTETGFVSPTVGGNKPNLPPKPTTTPTEPTINTPAEKANVALDSKGDEDLVDEPPYATIDKFKKSSISRKAPTTADHNHDADQSGEAEDSSANESTSHKTDSTTTFVLQPPSRRKRPRKRNKQPRAPEEDVYDGTKDYEDLEVDSGFYTDTSKTKIKRSSRLPVMKPDPNDTRYWITISNDY